MKYVQLAAIGTSLFALSVATGQDSAPRLLELPPVDRTAVSEVHLSSFADDVSEEVPEVVLTESGSSIPVELPSESTSGDPGTRIPRNTLPRRLPQTEPSEPASHSLLPPQLPELPEPIEINAAEQEIGNPVLLHAGGAIEAEFPAGWHVHEATFGRRIYAAIAPPETKLTGDIRHDGMWFSHVALQKGQAADTEALQRELTRHLSNLPGKAVVIQTNPPSMLGPWEAHSAVYHLSEPVAVAENQPTEEILGALMLVRTAWGLVAINAVAPRSKYEQRQEKYEMILQSIKLEAPGAARPLSPEGEAAAELLGSWKGSQARMRIYGDSRFEVVLDPQQPVQIHPPLPPEQRQQVRRVAGKFKRVDDILHVTWNDQSRSNFRYMIKQGELLLTDHDGKTSRLARIYE